MEENRQRLDELLRRRRRAGRVPKITGAWAAIGVSVSPLSADHQADLMHRLRTAGLRRSNVLPEPSRNTLSHDVGEFTRPLDMVVSIDWDVDEEPAVLLPAKALYRSAPHLRTLYPDGLLLLDHALTSALVIDFDEEDHSVFYVDRLSLGSEE